MTVPEGKSGATKRKARDGSSYLEEDDSSDDHGDPGQETGPTEKGKGVDPGRYACPYFKYNPAKYMNWSICPGPGWRDVHRVK